MSQTTRSTIILKVSINIPDREHHHIDVKQPDQTTVKQTVKTSQIHLFVYLFICLFKKTSAQAQRRRVRSPVQFRDCPAVAQFLHLETNCYVEWGVS